MRCSSVPVMCAFQVRPSHFGGDAANMGSPKEERFFSFEASATRFQHLFQDQKSLA